MHPLILSSWLPAVVGMMFGAMSLFVNNEEDLLDQPLPQYQRTEEAGFSETRPSSNPPSRSLEKSGTQVQTETATPKFGNGSELAPNPLATLLIQEEPQKDRQQSPSDNLPVDTTPGSINQEVDLPPQIETTRPEFVPTELKSQRIERVPATELPPNSFEKSPLPKPDRPLDTNVIPPTSLPQSKPFTILPSKTATLNAPSVRPKPTTESMRTAMPKLSEVKKKATTRQPVLNFEVYRDVSRYPIDPRKPNNPCTKGPNCGCGCRHSGKYGIKGRPYQPRELGGETCGDRCPSKRPQFSVYWPRPLSAKLDERDPDRAAARYSGCPEKRLVDVFDRLANFRLIDYQRTDNGYCGPEADPYGCLGESKYFDRVYTIPSSVELQAVGYPLD